MAYQTTFTNPYKAALEPAAYTIDTSIIVDPVTKNITVNFSTWVDKASQTAGKLPIALHSFTFPNAAAIVNSLQTSLDTAVVAGQVPLLPSATIVA